MDCTALRSIRVRTIEKVGVFARSCVARSCVVRSCVARSCAVLGGSWRGWGKEG